MEREGGNGKARGERGNMYVVYSKYCFCFLLLVCFVGSVLVGLAVYLSIYPLYTHEYKAVAYMGK